MFTPGYSIQKKDEFLLNRICANEKSDVGLQCAYSFTNTATVWRFTPRAEGRKLAEAGWKDIYKLCILSHSFRINIYKTMKIAPHSCTLLPWHV